MTTYRSCYALALAGSLLILSPARAEQVLRIGIEVRAVVKLHVVPQVEDPGLLVVGRLLPAFGEPRSQRCQPIGTR